MYSVACIPRAMLLYEAQQTELLIPVPKVICEVVGCWGEADFNVQPMDTLNTA